MIIAIGVYLVLGVAFFCFIVGKGKSRHNTRSSVIMAILWPWYTVRIVKILYKTRGKR